MRFAAEAEALGFGTAWLGLGRRTLPDLTLAERALDATTIIVVATAIVNMWTNDVASIAESYKRIDAKQPGRLLLGVGIGHPESITQFNSQDAQDSRPSSPQAPPARTTTTGQRMSLFFPGQAASRVVEYAHAVASRRPSGDRRPRP